jgi:ferredoxin
VDYDLCKGCLNCAAICPGLAITIVDYRKDAEYPTVTLPYEIRREKVEKGRQIPLTDEDGAILGHYPVERVVALPKKYPGTLLVQVKVEKKIAQNVIGIWVQEKQIEPSKIYEKGPLPDEAIICRCERVTAGEIRSWIKKGLRDMNELKAVTRAGMGACGSKTCRTMILRLFREEGVSIPDVTDRTDRPLFVEVSLGLLAGIRKAE